MANILASYLLVFRKAKLYSLYVLAVLFLVYMLNQLDRYALPIVNIETAQELHYGERSCLKTKFNNDSSLCNNLNETACGLVRVNTTNGTAESCKYDYNGQGIEYQLLIGPYFVLIFTFTGLILSLVSDYLKNRRVFLLSCCIVFWSLMTFLSGFAKNYWELSLFRFGTGIGEAGCNPLATALIAEYFELELRGAALGIYNWGIYTGYSLSFAIGNQILKSLGWQWVFYICGIPGFVVGALLYVTVREPKVANANDVAPNISSSQTQQPQESSLQKLKSVSKEFFRPTLLLLCLAGSIRNAAGYVWGTNNNTYYKKLGQTPDEISAYLGVIPIVFGIIGSFVGGFVSDRVAKKAKPWQRIWVLVLSQIIAAPFVAAVLFFDPPVSYFFLIPAYIFGEMWVGVLLSIIVELVPERLRTTGIGLYFFIITNIGGNMQLLVPPVQDAMKKTFNLNDIQAFRAALYIFYPGEYVIGSALFLLTLFVIKRDLKNVETNSSSEISSSKNPLIGDESDDSQINPVVQGSQKNVNKVD